MESAEGDAGDATGGLTIFDPVVTITNEQIEGELDQMLSQWLSGGSEVQEVTISDGQIIVVVLPCLFPNYPRRR